ncbi:chemotaxis protein CheB [Aliikangiella sp. IMCC44359]|uniref:chemotaxis protein CheB n=1 Tax=Aliikangiella sp. IMCC44359 TaxID=3459125 RepID=UPI00403AE689
MSGLKLGLVASSTDETKQLIKLLEDSAVEIVYNINPENITDKHVDDDSLHVWLLCVDDESWHDAVDHLLDESEIPVYFSEPGTLAKQSHPDFWCTNLLNRLYEITGLTPSKTEDKNTDNLDNNKDKDEKRQADSVLAEQNASKTETSNRLNEQTPLSNSLNELESSTVSLPSDIAAELVSELESISPVLIEPVSAEKQNLVDESEKNIEISIDDFSIEESVVEVESLIEEETTLDDLTLDELSLDDELLENKDLTDLELEVDDEFSLELESEGNIDDVTENVTQENTIDIQESLALDDPDLNELVIEAIEPENIEPEEVKLEEIEAEEVESTFSLEPVDNISVNTSGVADFSIDDDGGLEETQTESEQAEVSLDSGLTLEEFPDEKPITGKASFSIDDSDDISQQEKNEVVEAKAEKSLTAETAQEESYGLSLEAIEEEAEKPVWLNSDSVEEQVIDNNFNESNIETELLEGSESHTETLEVLEIGSLDDEFSLDNIDSVELSEQKTTERLEEPIELAEDSLEDDSFSLGELDVNEEQSELEKEELELISEEIEGELSYNESTFYEHTIDEFDNDDDLALESLADVALDSEVVQKMEIDSTSIQEIARRAVSHEKSDTAQGSATESKKSVSNVNHEPESEISADHSATEEFEIPMLDETAFDIEFEEKDTSPKASVRLSPCWVIGASLGGPAAVKRFLNCIPPDINASMIIAQHIDENFLPVLADILTSNSQFDVTIANGSNELKPGKVLLAPLKGKIVILQDGSMLIDHSQKWSAPYSPCIDDVIESVSNVYGHLSATIIFSGMGDDGLAGAKKLHQAGGKVWAQSMDTCANASMPEAIITNELAEFIGSPEQLAEQMISTLNG